MTLLWSYVQYRVFDLCSSLSVRALSTYQTGSRDTTSCIVPGSDHLAGARAERALPLVIITSDPIVRFAGLKRLNKALHSLFETNYGLN